MNKPIVISEILLWALFAGAVLFLFWPFLKTLV